jgi:predicted RecB family nuclease
MDLLPSVTTILRVTHKQALVEWLIEQACMTVLTAPRLANEQLDAFVQRVLKTERQQDAEAAKARDLGTAIHGEIEARLGGAIPDESLAVYVDPVIRLVGSLGNVVATEKIVVGDGYAGKTDCITDGQDITVVDFKTAKKLPDKGSWDEHRLQLAAYAKALGSTGNKRVSTANIYISTTEPGQCRLFTCNDWQDTFEYGFKPLVQYWKWLNNY